MWWLLFSLSALAQDDLDLAPIRALEEELPNTQYSGDTAGIKQRIHTSKHRSPYRKVTMDQILSSGTEHGHLKAGRYLIRLKDNRPVEITEEFFGKFYRLQDDMGFKYIQNNDGSCLYKIKSEFFNGIDKELALYEPPLKYTPAPTNIVRSDYDKKLRLLPEAALFAGIVQGDYMVDLFNDEEASSGLSTQYAAHVATKWDLPVQVGAVLHHEQTSYSLRGGGKIEYSATSFGPQFKTKDFDVAGNPLRFQTQFRVSPFAKAYGQTTNGNISFKFNSADLLVSAEHPIKNKLGEFVLGLYFQSQWLNIKEQPEIVSINATNEINKSFGLSLAQVFE